MGGATINGAGTVVRGSTSGSSGERVRMPFESAAGPCTDAALAPPTAKGMRMDNTGCAQVPLVELLRSVPKDARAEIELGPCHHRFIPWGRHCHDAADAIDAAEARGFAAGREEASAQLFAADNLADRVDVWHERAGSWADVENALTTYRAVRAPKAAP